MKTKFKEISLSTREESDLVDITEEVSSFVKESEIESGICLINFPHSTNAIIVNEHESGLMEDILGKVREEFPRGAGWHHDRGAACMHWLIGSKSTRTQFQWRAQPPYQN